MPRFVGFLTVLMLTAFPPAVFAHAVGVSCSIHGNRIDVEAYYDNDTPAVKAKVSVHDAQDAVIASGISDEKGRWSFAKPAPGRYKVHLDAGAGHRAKTMVVVTGAAEPADEPPANPAAPRTFASAWANLLIGLAIIAGGGTIVMLMARWRSKARRTGNASQI